VIASQSRGRDQRREGHRDGERQRRRHTRYLSQRRAIPKGAVPKPDMSQGKAEMLHLHVSGTVADVVKTYQEMLKEKGWEIETTMNMGDGSMLQAKKPARQCAALVMKDDSGSLIQLTVTQE